MIVVRTRPFSSCVVHLKGFSPTIDYHIQFGKCYLLQINIIFKFQYSNLKSIPTSMDIGNIP
jgi:hypothetical protein